MPLAPTGASQRPAFCRGYGCHSRLPLGRHAQRMERSVPQRRRCPVVQCRPAGGARGRVRRRRTFRVLGV